MSQEKSLVHAPDRKTFIGNNMASEQPPPRPEKKPSRMSLVQECGSALQDSVLCVTKTQNSSQSLTKKMKTQKHE